MNSLIPRLKRHLSSEKKLHWHIDYFLKNINTTIKEIIFNIDENRIECDLANLIAKNGFEIPKFGSSDCNCNSHLILFNNYQNAFDNVKIAFEKLSNNHYDLNYLKKL